MLPDKKDTKSLVFVYGTLKKGRANHDLLKGEEYLGEYYTGPGYRLYNLGLPYLHEDGVSEGCTGELYLISRLKLELLDRLEGHPDWYERKFIRVYPLGEHAPCKYAWCYLIKDKRV